MNCISAIGRMPMSAAPEAAPTMAISEIGVSITRSGAEAVDEARAGLEGAAVDADVLADEEDALVALHLFGQAPGGWLRGRCVSAISSIHPLE